MNHFLAFTLKQNIESSVSISDSNVGQLIETHAKRYLRMNERQTTQSIGFVATSGEKASNEPIQEQLDEFYAEKASLLRQIAELERHIDITTTSDISNKQLRERNKGLAEIYRGLSLDKKKKLTNILVTEIECYLKKKKTKGLLKFNLRGDGALDFDFKKQTKN